MPHKKEGVSSEGFIFFDHYYEIGRNGYTTNNDYQDSNVDYLYEPFYRKMTVTLNVSYDPYKVNETIRYGKITSTGLTYLGEIDKNYGKSISIKGEVGFEPLEQYEV